MTGILISRPLSNIKCSVEVAFESRLLCMPVHNVTCAILLKLPMGVKSLTRQAKGYVSLSNVALESSFRTKETYSVRYHSCISKHNKPKFPSSIALGG